MDTKTIIPVILNGGSGTRLWPLSRQDTPKQFLNLLGDYSLFQASVLRALDISGAPASQLVVVTLADMHAETARQLNELAPDLTGHILCEPQGRNTAAAISLAAHYVRRQFGDEAIIWVLPSDSYVGNEAALRDALEKAAAAARDGYLVVLGVKPTRPETGYGYIGIGSATNNEGVFGVEGFVEKPDRATAQGFVDAGNYLWSKGMHVFEARNVLGNYSTHAPHTHQQVQRAFLANPPGKMPAAEIYGTITVEPYEKAVLEKASRLAVVPCEANWFDVGTWNSVWEIGDKDPNGNVTEGPVICHSTQNSLVYAKGDRRVACIGMKDVIVVDTGDAVMVADRNNPESIRAVVRALQEAGFKEVFSERDIEAIAAGDRRFAAE